MGFGFQRTNQLKPGDLCSAEDAGPPALVESSQLDSLTVPAKPADSRPTSTLGITQPVGPPAPPRSVTLLFAIVKMINHP